jgi:hypothetical protein
MNFIRRYGWYVFLIPPAIFLLDDFATNWHDHGHERILYIVLENIGEDIAALLFFVVARAWQNRSIPHLHAECPKCHFKWLMHPKQRMLFCPHCGAPEPRPVHSTNPSRLGPQS